MQSRRQAQGTSLAENQKNALASIQTGAVTRHTRAMLLAYLGADPPNGCGPCHSLAAGRVDYG